MKTKAEKLLLHYIRLWNLIPDGTKFFTHSSLLQPVLYEGNNAMLKIPIAIEEKMGSRLMIWWNGLGAAKVLEHDDSAILMERVSDDCSLFTMAIDNEDDKASRIICNVADLLHSCKKRPFPELVPLKIWFKDLFLHAENLGESFRKCADVATYLLKNQREIVVLHGDLHHKNILHSPDRGWLAIDPKGLVGERTFDYVNILCNPNEDIALRNGRLACQIDIISKSSKIDPDYLLKWTVAWAGLSAVWALSEGTKTNIALDVLDIALNELNS